MKDFSSQCFISEAVGSKHLINEVATQCDLIANEGEDADRIADLEQQLLEERR